MKLGSDEIEHGYRRILRQLVINVRNIDMFIEHIKTVETMHQAAKAGVIKNAQKSRHTFERCLSRHRPGLKHFWGTCERKEIADMENWIPPKYAKDEDGQNNHASLEAYGKRLREEVDGQISEA